jgi:HlyD family secretion protein
VINFDVKVAVLDKIDNIRPGMSSNVDIITDVRTDVLNVPIQAVTVRTKGEINRSKQPKNRRRRNAKSDTTNNKVSGNSITDDEGDLEEIVFVVENKVAKLRSIKTGITGETNIEILDGLEEGETVVTGSYRILSKELRHDSNVKIEKARRFQSRNEESE